MIFQRTPLSINLLILILIASHRVQAKHITECDGASGYITNPSSCSDYIYCDGEDSIYCSGNCAEELDCDSVESTTGTTTTTGTAGTGTATSTVTTSVTETPLTTETSESTTIGSTTSTGTTASTSTGNSIRDTCRKGVNDKYPYSNNCNYFYQCIDGYLLLQQCPFGFGWDVDSARCMEMKKVHCENE